MNDSLYNAPPRLSDLRGDERTAALKARHEGHREDWLATRQRRPLLVRLVERFQGGAS